MDVPVWEKMNWTIEEAAAMTNIGKDRLRELANRPNCPFTIRIGSKILIKKEQFAKYNATAQII